MYLLLPDLGRFPYAGDTSPRFTPQQLDANKLQIKGVGLGKDMLPDVCMAVGL